MDIKIVEIVKTWFDKADNWQKDLFINLWKGKNVEEIRKRALKLAYKEYEIEDCSFVSETKFPSDIDGDANATSTTSLISISNVQGVSALKPTRALEFSDGLNVVYGGNGCGKSSYVKILKKAENPKSNTKIYSNIFEEITVSPKATLIFSEDGSFHEVEWSLTNKDVCPIRIYDTEIANSFVKDSTETIYEPKLLNVFTKMVEMFDFLYREIADEISNKKAQMASIPFELQKADLALKFESISKEKALDDFQQLIDFSEDDKTTLSLIENNFADNNPNLTCKKLNAQIEIIKQIKEQLDTVFVDLDDSKVTEFLHARENQIQTRKIYEEFIEETKDISKLDGFGSDKWKDMWRTSREFKEAIISADNICVLCQQELSTDAKERMVKFQEVYLSKLETNQQKAHDEYKHKIDLIQNLISNKLNINDTKLKLTTNSFDDDIILYIEQIVRGLLNRAKWLFDYENRMEETCPDISKLEEFDKKLISFIEQKTKEIGSLNEFIENYEKQLKERQMLQAKKWFSENEDTLSLKRYILKLNTIHSKFKTNTLTKTKNQLSEKLITDVYIERFNKELKELNPTGSIKVELISDGKKGRTSHRVSIKGAKEKRNTDEILSEGESRVVSIAAFLADLNSINKTQAFIFDDPITSLDHNYEDNVAKQLVDLSFERQVIVFTHRLAFAETLQNCMDEAISKSPIQTNVKFNYIELLNEPLGEPINMGYYNKLKFESELNVIKNQDIPKIKKLQETQEYDLAKSKLESVCSKMRKVIERGIETELLNGVVTRYSMRISSLKIRYLNAITSDDVKLFEDMMTNYSYFEHSNPSEKPVPLPSLDKLLSDVDKLLKWNNDYKKRLKSC